MTLCLRGVLVLAFLATVPIALASADESSLTSVTSPHPLMRTIQYATSHSKYIREHVRDYTCQLVKRERIDGELQSYQSANVKVRCEQLTQDRVRQPMAVLLQFKAPTSLSGRIVLYVDGKNEGLALVRKGGTGLFKDVELEIDPLGAAARRESNYPITEVGFDRIMDRLSERIKDDMKHDPLGTNTTVSYFRNAKVKDRICTHVRVVHPERAEGLTFHQASLFIDDDLHVPIRLVVYGWPRGQDETPPLMEEYNYVNLQLNVGLTESDFAKSRYFDDE